MDLAPLPGTSDEFFTNSFPEDKEGRYTLYKYDLLNRLVSVSRLNDEGEVEVAASYRYSHRNLRIERTDKAGTVRYVFDLDGSIIEEHRGDELIRYVFRRGKHLAKITPDGTYYYGTDRLGSTTVMFDGEGSVVWRGDVSPFGELVSSEGSIEERVKFTGKDYDEAAGLYYFNARWYDAELGRFTTEDPARDGRNWYVYVRNNPLRFVDPTGLEWIITNTFGAEGPYKDTNGLHSGIDMIWVEKDGSNGTTGQTVLPLEPGIVSLIKNDTKGGKTVFIKHKDNRRSTYQHNTEILVNVGDEVNLDTPIAYAGNDGENSTGPHVHFDIYNNTGSPAGQKIKPVLKLKTRERPKRKNQYYIEPSESLVTDYIDRMTEAAEQAGREECTK